MEIQEPGTTVRAGTVRAERLREPVVVVGAGLAGLAAALRLAELGVPVTLVEASRRLGGRAGSFFDPVSQQFLDTGQHILMKCCTYLLDFYQRLGVAETIRWYPRPALVLTAAHEPVQLDHLSADDLPAPLHLLPSLLAVRGLSAGRKLTLLRGLWTLLRTNPDAAALWHRRSFAAWLDQYGQDADLTARFWAPIAVGAVNEQPDNMAADYAWMVFHNILFRHEEGYILGLASVPLERLYRAVRWTIEKAGGRLLLGHRVQQLIWDSSRRIVTDLELACSAGQLQKLAAADFILAIPPDRLARLCPPVLRAADVRLAELEKFRFSPIIAVHLFLACPGDRLWIDEPIIMLSCSPVHSIFNKGRLILSGLAPMLSRRLPVAAEWNTASLSVQYIQAVISAATDLVERPAAELIQLAMDQLSRLTDFIPAEALVYARVVKEKHATFSAFPGVNDLRPPVVLPENQAGAENLFLAGDWCRTGWPATMESAVRSGYMAAQALLQRRGVPADFRIPDLPARPLYQWLSRYASQLC